MDIHTSGMVSDDDEDYDQDDDVMYKKGNNGALTATQGDTPMLSRCQK